MEVDQIQYKLQRSNNGNGRIASTKLGQNRKMDNYQYPYEEEEIEHKQGTPEAAACGGGIGSFYGWPSSRIVRVSRASGGKDRHSKVLTSKGLRDRRVRLSVNTAIQFYDLQDRLGYDQPSKAVEWLLKAAASSIAELPPMNLPLPATPKQMSDEKRSSTTAGSDMDGGGGCGADPSSTSETSKGSSRSETRTKARERAKGRVAEKDKEKEKESSHNPSSFSHMNQASSFTELLNGGGTNGTITNGRQWPSPQMDYFTNGFSPPLTAAGGGHSSELHHFSFGPDSYVINSGSGEYNLNFSISSANSAGVFAGYNRGTLQSNSSPSPSLLRFSPAEGSHQNFFMGGAAATALENHHQFLSGFDSRYSGQKGKGKN